MARFDVFENKNGADYLLDVQSDLLSGLNPGLWCHCCPKTGAPAPAQRLNPVFNIKENTVIMTTQYMAAVPESELRSAVGHLADQQGIWAPPRSPAS
ncbi:plasmid maintenance protein CcdB [Marinobacter fuscus]|uniref:Toxin CcdB n=1 Tax=Marinobacter fuscus TaxID=2109942 RepID=A0A2T1KLP7_9GAMM|nr:CcdB family protein [Marinobacter fuscus]PSF10552.1 plasmid maintenance protein CcdB [Marinobacter fuscus]